MSFEPSFTGQTAVVTGASSGIGAAIARALAAAGARVHALARAPGEAAERLVWHRVDLAEDAAIEGFTAGLAPETLDILVHGAGLLTSGTVAATPIAELDRQYQVNLRAPYLLTQGLLPALTRGRGQIVFVNSSVYGNARAGMTGYAASKYALKASPTRCAPRSMTAACACSASFPAAPPAACRPRSTPPRARPYRPEALLQPGDIAADRARRPRPAPRRGGDRPPHPSGAKELIAPGLTLRPARTRSCRDAARGRRR